MEQKYFDELAGRIDGLARIVLFLVDDAVQEGLIDGEEFTDRLRQFSLKLDFEQPHLEATKRTMVELAAQIDTVRNRRLSLVREDKTT